MVEPMVTVETLNIPDLYHRNILFDELDLNPGGRVVVLLGRVPIHPNF